MSVHYEVYTEANEAVFILDKTGQTVYGELGEWLGESVLSQAQNDRADRLCAAFNAGTNCYFMLDSDSFAAYHPSLAKTQGIETGAHSYVILNHNQDGFHFVGTDSAEPEDKILPRDFSWVLTELNKAAGFSDTAPQEPDPDVLKLNWEGRTARYDTRGDESDTVLIFASSGFLLTTLTPGEIEQLYKFSQKRQKRYS